MRPGARRRGAGVWPTLVLVVGAIYCLVPVYWLVSASTKRAGELFTTFTLAPSFTGGFVENLRGLFALGDGSFLRWSLNSLLYAGGGALLGTAVAALAGYGLAKYRFPGKTLVFNLLLVGVLVPGVILSVPQYLLLSEVGLAGTYLAVLLPCTIAPFSIYLVRVYTASAVPDELLEAGRIDGAHEGRIFWSVGLAPMLPGLVTVFLLQFVGIWNNFLLPYIMLTDPDLYPLTVGFYSLMNQGVDQPNVYNTVVMGCLLAVLPLIALFLFLQRYWRLDLVSGSVKG